MHVSAEHFNNSTSHVTVSPCPREKTELASRGYESGKHSSLGLWKYLGSRSFRRRHFEAGMF